MLGGRCEQEICRSLRDHQCWSGGVTVGGHRHHGSICDAQSTHSVDTKLRVDNGETVGADPSRAYLMMTAIGGSADIVAQRVARRARGSGITPLT